MSQELIHDQANLFSNAKEILTISTKSNDDFVLFDEPYTITKKVPCHVNMTSIDSKMPPVATLEKGANAIRAYWNNKNIRRRISK